MGINKSFFERWLLRIKAMVSPEPRCYWLFMARINELALFCAARYVDCCEFTRAGELMMKPNQFLIRRKGESGESSKQCHIIRTLPLSCLTNEKETLIDLLKKHLQMGDECESLLPYLHKELESSGYMARDYMLSVYTRMQQIIEVAGALAHMGMMDTEEMSQRLSCMDDNQRRNFELSLCRFDQRIFNDMGRELHRLMRQDDISRKYLVNETEYVPLDHYSNLNGFLN